MLDSQGFGLYVERLRKMLQTDTARLVDAASVDEMRVLQGRIRATREALEIPKRLMEEHRGTKSRPLAD